MKKSILIFVKTVVVFGMFFVAGCGKESGNGTSSGGAVPDPEGTIIVKMRNCDNGCTRVSPDGEGRGSFCIGSDNNFSDYSYYGFWSFARIGKVSGLGSITTIPNSGYAEQVAVEPECGYVARHAAGTYVRIYVVDWIKSTSGGIIGAEIKYQSPFIP